MKTMKTLGAMLALTTVALVGCQGEDVDKESSEQALVAPSAGDSAEAASAPVRPEAAKWFARLDRDGDGRIVVGELPERKRAHLIKADLDGDGAITLAEMQTAHRQRKAERFAKADKNADGILTKDEVEARHWEFLAVADADGDDAVSKAELEAAHAAGTLRPPAGARSKLGHAESDD